MQVLEPYRSAELGLAALVTAARAILAAVGGAGPTPGGDERVSAAPDARTIRYYQSLGILDRPARHDGREAVYGYRHLLQAVVTKLLQAEGHSLAQVQRALLGRSTDALEAAVVEALAGGAQAPDTLAPPDPAPVPSPPPPTHRHELRTLLTREVVPGVIVTIDPRLVPHPDFVLARITLALDPSGGSR